MMDTDPYLKKTVTLRHGGHTLRFHVAQDLFSSHEVDIGTRLLLRTLTEHQGISFQKILDIGCGYGPIGLTLKKLSRCNTVHMIDRDALAVEYTRRNTSLNGLGGVAAYGSLGYDDITTRDFDLIASNLPGKAGESVISHLLLDAVHFLRPGGLVAVVVVAPLETVVAGILRSAPHITVRFHTRASGYAVFHYTFSEDGRIEPPPSLCALSRGIYRRQDTISDLRGREYTLETARGLPEFDSPSFQSELLKEALWNTRDSDIGDVLALNPGHGHVPVSLWGLLGPKSIHLVDRDLLALRYSKNNLLRNGCPDERISLTHQVGIAMQDRRFDLIVGALRKSDGNEGLLTTITQASEQISYDGNVVMAATSAAITRLEKLVRSKKLLRIAGRKRKKGHSVLILKQRVSQGRDEAR